MNVNRKTTNNIVRWKVQLYFPELKRWQDYSQPLEYDHAVYALHKIGEIGRYKCRLLKVVM